MDAKPADAGLNLVNGLVPCTAAELPSGGTGAFFTAKDGARLRYAIWTQANAAKGSVFILPGRTEFIEKYGELIGELLARGFNVAAIDWRGQGLSARLLSDPLRGHIADFRVYVEDFAALAAGPFASMPKPWTLLAHSMGGGIGMQILQLHPEFAQAAIFSAPLLNILTARIPKPVARLIGLGAKLGFAGSYVPSGRGKTILEEDFSENVVTHDERRYERPKSVALAEPRLALAAPTIGWAQAVFEGADRIFAPGALEVVKIPLLLLIAAEEALIDNDATRAASKRLPNARLVEIPGSRHEILMELDPVREIFWSEFDGFMTSKNSNS